MFDYCFADAMPGAGQALGLANTAIEAATEPTSEAAEQNSVSRPKAPQKLKRHKHNPTEEEDQDSSAQPRGKRHKASHKSKVDTNHSKDTETFISKSNGQADKLPSNGFLKPKDLHSRTVRQADQSAAEDDAESNSGHESASQGKHKESPTRCYVDRRFCLPAS